MNQDNISKLWRLRFEKVLKLEEDSFDYYQTLIKEKTRLLERSDLLDLIEEISRDEAKHIRIAKELLRLIADEKEKGGQKN